uniref:Small integral membrane protein 4 n=1 Tax=Ciona savignyi TaxID=51511 RepID=H2YF49_CIOSA
MNIFSRLIQTFLYLYPIKGKSPYKFVPLFFTIGGAIEWVMIKVPAAGKGETFYDVWRRNQSERAYRQRLKEE